jgi:4-aminobutyrate aminotransferase
VAAFKLARHFTRRPRMLAFTGAFHGRTLGALSLTASKPVQRRHFAPLVPEVTHVPYAYCYRCPWGLKPETCDSACVQRIEDDVLRRYIPPEEVAAIFVEPIQGEGGYVVPPPGWFEALSRLARKYGMLLVVDEIQSGSGRTGKMFAIEHCQVEPDIVCVAKGLASGLPLGAMVSRADLHTWESGAHASTFGGNPVACVAAIETLRLVQEGLMKNAQAVGAHVLERLRELATRHPMIGDVRGRGLMAAIEIVRNRDTKEKDPEARNRMVQECFARGLLLLGCDDNSVRFCPPLIVTTEDVDTALGILDAVLGKLAAVA